MYRNIGEAKYAVSETADLKQGPSKQSELSSEMGELNDACEDLHNALAQLEGKLTPILRAISEVDGKSVPEAPLTLLAESIRNRRKSVVAARMFVNDMMSRLEL